MPDINTKGARVLSHSSIRIENEKIVYFDPYQMNEERKDADIIFITHDHGKHFSPEDIRKVRKDDTRIVVPESLTTEISKLQFDKRNIKVVHPGRVYEFANIIFETVPAYNVLRPYHPKKNGWVGYLIQINGTRYFVNGDSDVTKENKKVRCDIAFVPIGGTYTMNAKEAAGLINCIGPKIAIPVHYERQEDVNDFRKKLSVGIECVEMLF